MLSKRDEVEMLADLEKELERRIDLENDLAFIEFEHVTGRAKHEITSAMEESYLQALGRG